MAGLSNQLEQEFLNHAFVPAQPAYSPPAQHYISLHDSGGPDDDGSTEITGGSYARFAVGTPATFWNAAASRQITNAQVAQWTDMPAVSLTGVGIWNHATLSAAANFMAGGVLVGAPIAVSAGATVEFGAGQLIINWNPLHFTDYLVNGFLDFMLRGQAFTRPTSHNLMIYNGDPTAAGTPISGATLQAITFNNPSASAPRHDISNNGDVTFSSLNADTLTYWGVEDHLTNLLGYRNQATVNIQNGNDVTFTDGTDVILGVD